MAEKGCFGYARQPQKCGERQRTIGCKGLYDFDPPLVCVRLKYRYYLGRPIVGKILAGEHPCERGLERLRLWQRTVAAASIVDVRRLALDVNQPASVQSTEVDARRRDGQPKLVREHGHALGSFRREHRLQELQPVDVGECPRRPPHSRSQRFFHAAYYSTFRPHTTTGLYKVRG